MFCVKIPKKYLVRKSFVCKKNQLKIIFEKILPEHLLVLCGVRKTLNEEVFQTQNAPKKVLADCIQNKTHTLKIDIICVANNHFLIQFKDGLWITIKIIEYCQNSKLCTASGIFSIIRLYFVNTLAVESVSSSFARSDCS